MAKADERCANLIEIKIKKKSKQNHPFRTVDWATINCFDLLDGVESTHKRLLNFSIFLPNRKPSNRSFGVFAHRSANRQCATIFAVAATVTSASSL